MVTSHQLRRLSARAAHLDAGSHHDGELRAFVWSTAVLWLRLGLATTVAYAVQENTERVVVGLAPSGLDALAAHGLLPIIVILVTSLAIATVAALVRWRCETLLARLARRIAPLLSVRASVRVDGRAASHRATRAWEPCTSGARARRLNDGRPPLGMDRMPRPPTDPEGKPRAPYPVPTRPRWRRNPHAPAPPS
jgi:hypothetical protein